MLLFKNRFRKNRELEVFLEKIQSNMANNYKDAAQNYLKEYEACLKELTHAGSLNEKQKIYYEAELHRFRERMKGFSHKEQKPYWT